MNITLWLSFVGTVLLIAFTPGPSVLLATANSMNHGVAKATGTILGDLTANFFQIILSSLGLATIIMASGEVFYAIKWFGVAYLMYMGITKFFSKTVTGDFQSVSKEKNFSNLYWEGFMMSASNPKAIVFFAALFPLFIDPNLSFVWQVVVLGVSFLLIDGFSLSVYVYFASRLKSYLENKEKIQLQNKIIGALLIFSGLMLSMVKHDPR